MKRMCHHRLMERPAEGLTISQLSKASGVHPSTIKFYISEGLLPRGRLIASNRALYGPDHLDRLRMLRTLVVVGGVGIAQLRRIVTAIDSGRTVDMLAAAQDAVSEEATEPSRAENVTLALVRERFGIAEGSPLFHHPSIYRVAATIDAAAPLLGPGAAAWALALLDSAELAATADLDLLDRVEDPDHAVQLVSVGTALGDVVLAHARRIAQSVTASARYGPGAARHAPPDRTPD